MDDTDAQAQSYWPVLEELARPARERRRLPPETRSQLIVQLCAKAPLSVKELSMLLDRSEAYVGDAIRPLVNAGNLTFLYPDQPRHPRQKYIAAQHANGTSVTAPAPAPAPSSTNVPTSHVRYAPPTPARPQPVVVVQAPPPPPPPPAPVQPAPVSRQSEPQPAAVRPAPAPASPQPAPLEEPVVEERRVPRFPNQWTNVAYVIAVGLILGFTSLTTWPGLAALSAVALSWWHLTADSAQYRRFRTLQAKRNRRVTFVLLKSAVTLAEIAVIYFFTLAYNGRL